MQGIQNQNNATFPVALHQKGAFTPGETRWLNQLQAHLGSLSTEEQCSVWKKTSPSPRVCAGWGAVPFPDGSGINITSWKGGNLLLWLSLERAHALGTRCPMSSVVSYGNILLQAASARQYTKVLLAVSLQGVYIPARKALRLWYLCTSPSYQPLT